MHNPAKRRTFVQACALTLGSSIFPRLHHKVTAQDSHDHERSQRFSVSTYSFWQFRGPKVPIETCIDHAARMNFDGLEILEMQMTDSSNPYLQQLKRRAHSHGLASAHGGHGATRHGRGGVSGGTVHTPDLPQPFRPLAGEP